MRADPSVEPFLLLSLLSLAMFCSWRSLWLARYERTQGSDEFRFDVHRTLCAFWFFIACACSASLTSRMIGAHTEVIAWPWLGLVFWLCGGSAGAFWSIVRHQARIGQHPFWGSKISPSRPEMLAILLNAHSSGVCMFVDHEDRFLCVSQAFELYFNRLPREVVGRRPIEVWTPTVARTLTRQIDAARAQKTRIQTEEVIGSDRWNLDFTPMSDGTVCIGAVNITRAGKALAPVLQLHAGEICGKATH